MDHQLLTVMTLTLTTNHFRDQLEACHDYASAAKVAYSHSLTVRQKAGELAESIYWLGAAVARAESLSSYGDAFYETISRDTGLSASMLRRAVKWYDLVGDESELRRILKQEEDLSARSITALIKENGARIDERREHRHYVDRMVSAGRVPRLPAPKVEPLRKPRGHPRSINQINQVRINCKGIAPQVRSAAIRLRRGSRSAIVRKIDLPDGRTATLTLTLDEA